MQQSGNPFASHPTHARAIASIPIVDLPFVGMPVLAIHDALPRERPPIRVAIG